ncbi:MAG: ferritin-like domain-containing protein [Polyangiaceae bacterium]|nr:ferritin-like domain-containing protein [Polyangiaceae bacterium]
MLLRVSTTDPGAPSGGAGNGECSVCPELGGNVTFQGCTPQQNETLCEYSSGYADPEGDFKEAEEATCDATCSAFEGAEKTRTGCLATNAGSACVVERYCVGGRRYEAMPAFEQRGTGLGWYYAEMAYLEAGSVTAFESLATEIESIGAPAWLVRKCRAAAKDEQRHANLVAELAAQHGYGHATEAPKEQPPPRTLGELAVENAVEGTREMYGAFVAAWMARLAPGDVSRTLRSIARDEARHALLSTMIEAWAVRSLDDGARAEVEAARRRAVGELVDVPHDPALEELGATVEEQAQARGRLTAFLQRTVPSSSPLSMSSTSTLFPVPT